MHILTETQFVTALFTAPFLALCAIYALGMWIAAPRVERKPVRVIIEKDLP
jgi:hypothetical protein